MRLYTTQRTSGTLPVGAFLLVPMFLLPLGGWFIENQIIELGVCGMRQALDLPCLSCGATRATLALMSGELVAALSLQPLIISLYFIVGTWGIASLATFALDRKLVMDLNRTEDLVFKIALVVVPLANWAYLIWQDV